LGLNWDLRELILDSRFAHLMCKDEGEDQAEIFRASATCAAGTRATILFAHEKCYPLPVRVTPENFEAGAPFIEARVLAW